MIAGRELDELGHAVLHVVGVVVVAELAVDPELHVDVVGVRRSRRRWRCTGRCGAKVSNDLPSQLPAFQVRRPSPRAETSIMPV